METHHPADPRPPGQKPGETAKPFSIRLTAEERKALALRAGRTPLGTYVRDLILSQDAQAGRRRWASPVADEAALARVLATLGQSRLSSNLNQLAKAANMGRLQVTPEAVAELSATCSAIASMRGDLIQALGLIESGRS